MIMGKGKSSNICPCGKIGLIRYLVTVETASSNLVKGAQKNLIFSKFFAIIFIENETKNANENDCGLQTNIEMSDSRRNWTPQKAKGDTTVPDS